VGAEPVAQPLRLGGGQTLMSFGHTGSINSIWVAVLDDALAQAVQVLRAAPWPSPPGSQRADLAGRSP